MSCYAAGDCSCSRCNGGTRKEEPRIVQKSLREYSSEQLRAELEVRKLDRKKEAEKRLIQKEINDLQKKIYALQRKLKNG